MLEAVKIVACTCLAYGVLIGTGIGQEKADPVATQLENARQKYKKEWDQFEKSVRDLLEKKEEAARKAGNKQALNIVQSERKAFEDDAVIPTFAPPAIARKQSLIRADLERAYNAAIKDYIKKREDEEAKKIEDELNEFRNAPKIVAIRRALVGTWTLRVVSGYTTDLVFDQDGTVKYGINGSTVNYRIDVDAGFVYLGEGKDPDRIKLPLNGDRADGFNSAGQDTTFSKKK